MRLGLRLPTYVFDDGKSPSATATLDQLVEFAKVAERCGFHSLWTIDHPLVARPSYRVTFLDPLIVLSAIATVTDRIRLGTSILQLPLRHPVLVAKEVATLDWLSQGRIELGVGVGWNEQEFESLGVPIKQRGKRMDEYLAALTTLWSPSASFEGEFVAFQDIQILPRCKQEPHPPISIAGGSSVKPVYSDDPSYTKPPPRLKNVYARIARYASGWQATSASSPELISHDWQHICDEARAIGRNPDEIAKMQTIYLTQTEDQGVARQRFGAVVGKDFDTFLTQSSYLYGAPELLSSEIERRRKMGIDELILTPLTSDIDELHLWVQSFLAPHLAG